MVVKQAGQALTQVAGATQRLRWVLKKSAMNW